jgi:hypothetical protein
VVKIATSVMSILMRWLVLDKNGRCDAGSKLKNFNHLQNAIKT